MPARPFPFPDRTETDMAKASKSYRWIKLERDGGVAILTLNDPATLNAIQPAMNASPEEASNVVAGQIARDSSALMDVGLVSPTDRPTSAPPLNTMSVLWFCTRRWRRASFWVSKSTL